MSNAPCRLTPPINSSTLLRLALCALAAALATNVACHSPAIISYHEDLPAYSPAWGPPESRFGYHRVFWTDGSVLRPREYADMGLRVGQQTGRFAYEEGLAATLFESSFMFGPTIGVFLAEPAIALRGTWMPASVAGDYTVDRLRFSFKPSLWWQVTALAGTPYRPRGLGWAAGIRATKQGIGPLLTGEFGSGVLSLRAEASVTWLAPWASETARGTYIGLGIGAAHHGRERH